MFQGLLKRAENSVNQVIARTLERALVAVPLLVAAGFATAALTIKLIELYGSVIACGVMAAIFAVIGLVAMATVGSGTSEQASEEVSTEAEENRQSTTEGFMNDAADLLTPEVRSILASVAPMALPVAFRGVTKNLPLILMLTLAAFLISRFGASDGDGTPAAEPGDPADANPSSPQTHAAAA